MSISISSAPCEWLTGKPEIMRDKGAPTHTGEQDRIARSKIDLEPSPRLHAAGEKTGIAEYLADADDVESGIKTVDDTVTDGRRLRLEEIQNTRRRQRRVIRDIRDDRAAIEEMELVAEIGE